MFPPAADAMLLHVFVVYYISRVTPAIWIALTGCQVRFLVFITSLVPGFFIAVEDAISKKSEELGIWEDLEEDLVPPYKA